MTDPLNKRLRKWLNVLHRDIQDLEEVWIEIRRYKEIPRYLERADRLEDALDEIRKLRLDLFLELYGERKENGKQRTSEVS